MKSLLLVVFFAVVVTVTAVPVVKREVSISSSSTSSGSGGTFTSGFVATTGADGKIHYVKNVNGHIEQGVMNGPMPSIDLSGVLSNIPKPDKLNSAIQNSVSQLLGKLKLF